MKNNIKREIPSWCDIIPYFITHLQLMKVRKITFDRSVCSIPLGERASIHLCTNLVMSFIDLFKHNNFLQDRSSKQFII